MGRNNKPPNKGAQKQKVGVNNALVAAVEKQVAFSLAGQKKGDGGNYDCLDKNAKAYIRGCLPTFSKVLYHLFISLPP